MITSEAVSRATAELDARCLEAITAAWGARGFDPPDVAGMLSAGIIAMANGWSAQAAALESVTRKGVVGERKALREQAVAARAFGMRLVEGRVIELLAAQFSEAQAAPARPETLDEQLQRTFGPVVTPDLPAPRTESDPLAELVVDTTPGIEGDGVQVKTLTILQPGQAPTEPAASLTTPAFALHAVRAPVRLTWDDVAAIAAHPSIANREHVSPSTIKDLPDCGVKWLLGRTAARIHNVPVETPAWWNVGGTALHTAIRQLELAVSPISSPPADLDQLWRAAFASEIQAMELESGIPAELWRAADKGKENREWWAVAGRDMLGRYHAYHDRDWRQRYQIVGLEMPFALDLDDGFGRLEGAIDRVTFDQQLGEYGIVDFKSGSGQEDSTLQLGLYAWAWRRMASPGKRLAGPIRGAYWMARAGSHDLETADLSEQWPDGAVEYLARQALTLTRSGSFLPRISGKGLGCGSCSRRAVCPAQS